MNRGRTGGRNYGRGRGSRGRSSPSGGNSAHRSGRVEADGCSNDVPLNLKGNASPDISHQGSVQMSRGSFPKQSDCLLKPDNKCNQDVRWSAVKSISSDIRNLKLPEALGESSKQLNRFSSSGSKLEKDIPSLSSSSDPSDRHLNASRNQSRQTSGWGSGSRGSTHFVCSSAVGTVQNDSSPPAESGTYGSSSRKESENGQTSPGKASSAGRLDNFVGVAFDICPERTGTPVRLKATLLVKNREKRKERNLVMEGGNIRVLRSGMILLKSYISFRDQVKIVKRCRELGLCAGGFYQPGYRDGAKLHLKMMCLGKNWDPETSRYGDLRLTDGAQPPDIPYEFIQWVKGAIQESHDFLQKQDKASPRDIPLMSPNICIVNFYERSGRLGLHQDKDESPESLQRGLPVVSFSLGDSAEFLYGDVRETDKAEKVLLESGDVLIFGGKSRHIFHGVTAILSDTAPKDLTEESNLRPGRLNLTFREY